MTFPKWGSARIKIIRRGGPWFKSRTRKTNAWTERGFLLVRSILARWIYPWAVCICTCSGDGSTVVPREAIDSTLHLWSRSLEAWLDIKSLPQVYAENQGFCQGKTYTANGAVTTKVKVTNYERKARPEHCSNKNNKRKVGVSAPHRRRRLPGKPVFIVVVIVLIEGRGKTEH